MWFASILFFLIWVYIQEALFFQNVDGQKFFVGWLEFIYYLINVQKQAHCMKHPILYIRFYFHLIDSLIWTSMHKSIFFSTMKTFQKCRSSVHVNKRVVGYTSNKLNNNPMASILNIFVTLKYVLSTNETFYSCEHRFVK